MLKYTIAFFLLALPALAAEAPTPPPAINAPTDKPKPLTIGQVLQVSAGLAKMNCADRVLKDAGNEKMGCEPYAWSVGMSWRISEFQHRADDVVRLYYKKRNEALLVLPRLPDGKVAGDVDAKFALQDAEMLDLESGLTLEPHFKRGDLEPMKLPPPVLSALWPIIDP